MTMSHDQNKPQVESSSNLEEIEGLDPMDLSEEELDNVTGGVLDANCPGCPHPGFEQK
jgi:hypothetical protein